MATRSAAKANSKDKGTKKATGKAGANGRGAAAARGKAKPSAARAKAARPAAKEAAPVKAAGAKAAGEAKVELGKICPAYYTAEAEPRVIELPTVQYLAITGVGAPATEDFQRAVEVLFATAYTLKMTRKFGEGGDFKIAPLECLWWVNAPSDVFFLAHPEAFNQTSPDRWNWKLLLFVPNEVDELDLMAARRRLAAKQDPTLLMRVRLEILHEPKAVQILHVGPYASEPQSIRKMHELIQSQGLRPVGHHHEIYLSDPRHTAPDKIRTLLRHPVE